MLTLDALRRRLRRDDGFVMPIMMLTIVVVLIVIAGVFADVQNDLGPSRHDEDRKMAYAAAEAGIGDYLARLENNPSYWSKCLDSANPSLGNPGTKNFVSVPGSTEQYAIELLPTAGYSQCTVGTDGSFVNSAGEFKIRATGRSDSGGGDTRQIVATFRPKGFLNYIYYTDTEAKDPLLYAFDTDGAATRSSSQGDLISWAQSACMTTYWPARGNLLWSGQIQLSNGNWQNLSMRCSEISFGGGDRVAGPMHTNDQVHLCGTAYFGRKPTDTIEVGGSPGWTNICTSEKPNVNLPGSGQAINNTLGTWTIASQRDFPPTNAGLHDDAQTQYRFKGPTTITLNGANMHVTGLREDGTAVDADMPIPEGVVYVSDNAAAGSCPGLQPLAPYNGSSSGAPAGNPACGDIFLKGTYGQNVTFASGDDIVVTGNITRASDAYMLGIIPDKWARVYHPVNRSGSNCSDASSGRISNVNIDAAILALTHSFTVDAYECGAALGTLTIRGAIAQKSRGPVGTSGGTTGFIKSYQYDQRLAQRSPPRFLNPVQPAWAVADQTEQIPTS